MEPYEGWGTPDNRRVTEVEVGGPSAALPEGGGRWRGPEEAVRALADVEGYLAGLRLPPEVLAPLLARRRQLAELVRAHCDAVLAEPVPVDPTPGVRYFKAADHAQGVGKVHLGAVSWGTLVAACTVGTRRAYQGREIPGPAQVACKLCLALGPGAGGA